MLNWTELNNKLKSAIWKLITYTTIAPFCFSFGKNSNIVKPLIISGSKWIQIGNKCKINEQSFIIAREGKFGQPTLKIGDGVIFGHYNHIIATNSVVIGDNVLTADKVLIADSYHGFEDVTLPIVNQPIKSNDITIIGKDSWIGENVSVISCKIGEHCVIGANSVVTSDIPDFSVAVGCPAKVIKRYNFQRKLWENI